MKGISILNRLVLGSVAVLASSCGSMYASQPIYSSTAGLSTTTDSSSTTSSLTTVNQGKYVCPALDSPNVTPQYSVASTINGYFRVCNDPSSNTDIMVDGTFGNADQVCVFPLTATQAGTDQFYAYWTPNPNTGAPWYICQPASASGSVFTFSGLTTSWNAAYIVDAAYATQMQTCLIYGPGTFECPTYPQFSYGNI